jgi:hypothetical protein
MRVAEALKAGRIGVKKRRRRHGSEEILRKLRDAQRGQGPLTGPRESFPAVGRYS